MFVYYSVLHCAPGRGADVKRCLAMRGALALLDWADASIADLRRLLLRAAFAPAFLRAADGRRFLGHLFALDARAHDAMAYLLLK